MLVGVEVMKLLQISHDVMLVSGIVLAVGLFVGFGLENHVSLPVQVMGHALAMISAVGVKLGYIMRLEALAAQNRLSLEQKSAG